MLGILLAAQGLVGSVQYELQLPAEMVWVHVALATADWLVALWAIAVEGRLAPRARRVPAFGPDAGLEIACSARASDLSTCSRPERPLGGRAR